jgi:serine/threonine-protein kinase HipA
MSSDKETAFVWVYLPNQGSPSLCGRVTRSISASGAPLGEFIYQKAYLNNPNALSLDPVLLPLNERPVETSLLNGHFSVLLDAGPDAWGRREIDQAVGKQTDLGYLLHGAGDQVGAIAFSAAPEIAPPNAGFDGFPYTTLDELLIFAELLENDVPIPAQYERLLKIGTSVGGARPKATLLHDQRQWLAKFPSVRDPIDLPSNPKLEKSALDLAELAGLRVPQRQLIRVAGKDVLLVERFDRHLRHEGTNSEWCRRTYVSARTAFFSKPEVQRYTITGSYQRLSLELARWSKQTKTDRLELFKRIVFNCLVNNLDDHDCNHGFVDYGNGFELSPLFDVVPQRPTNTKPRLALELGKYGGIASKKNLLSECERFGLSTLEADQLIEAMHDVVKSNWKGCLLVNGVSNVHIERIASAFCPESFDL